MMTVRRLVYPVVCLYVLLCSPCVLLDLVDSSRMGSRIVLRFLLFLLLPRLLSSTYASPDTTSRYANIHRCSYTRFGNRSPLIPHHIMPCQDHVQSNTNGTIVVPVCNDQSSSVSLFLPKSTLADWSTTYSPGWNHANSSQGGQATCLKRNRQHHSAHP